jgi:PHS family inorganic phosphate transporter-like MFS transporter
MAITQEQLSSHESYQEKGQTNGTVLDERRRAALSEIDNAPFSYVLKSSLQFLQNIHLVPRWFHVKVCLVAGVGFFTDA